MRMTQSNLALITGANRGIGSAIGQVLAKAGFDVILTARDPAAVDLSPYKRFKNQQKTWALQLDVTRVDDIYNVCNWLSNQSVPLSLLVNNAGILRKNSPDKHSKGLDLAAKSSDLMDYFDVNTLGPIRTIEAFSPYMGNGARIINISSRMGQLCEMQGGNLGYRASKAALNAVTKVYASQLSPVGISVYSLCPGWVRTDMGGAHAPRNPDEAAEDIRWLATTQPAPDSGLFYRNRKVIPW